MSNKLSPGHITDAMVDRVEYEVGMGCGAWDMVDPKEIIASSINTYISATLSRGLVAGILSDIELAHVELSAMVADPENPDWMPALGNGNPADAACLQRAFEAIDDAIFQLKGGES